MRLQALLLVVGIVVTARHASADEPLELGLSPLAPSVSALVTPTQIETAETNSSRDWALQIHGFLRAPMAIGIGPRPNTVAGQSPLGVHSPPMTADSNYVNWGYTNLIGSPWAELKITFGNTRAAATVSLAAYNLTDAGYRNLTAQLGFNQAFLTLHFPRVVRRTDLVVNAGAFANGYGGSGKYDAGRYDTYVIGRTHVAGEQTNISIDLGHKWQLQIEQGFGVKLDVIPFQNNNTLPSYLPYPGPAAQGTTLLHHEHIGLKYSTKVLLGLHYLKAWTQDGRASIAGPDQNAPTDQPDGSQEIIGADVRFNGGVFGDGYFGVSRLAADHVLQVADAIEVIHSIGGWQLANNYLGPNCNGGTGTIWSLMFQYTFSLAKALRAPEPFWGQGPDVLCTFFGMANWVSSPDPIYHKITKFKWGADVTYLFLRWMGAAARFDMLEPNMNDDRRSFYAITANLIFRTAFVTHEQLIVGYTHYFYGPDVVATFQPGFPNSMFKPDPDALQIRAVMWW